MMKKHKWGLFFSSLMILLPYPFLYIFKDIIHKNQLPQGSFYFLSALPILLLLTQWLCLFFTAKDPKNRNQNKRVFGMGIWILPIVSLFVYCTFFSILQGKPISLKILLTLPMGMLFAFIGYLLPKCRQNNTIGIKVKWTLESEENWNMTHRVTGKVWFLCGIVMVFSSFLPKEVFLAVFFFSVVILSSFPILYSFLYFKKQISAGTAAWTPISKTEKRIGVAVTAFVSLLLLFVGILLFTGSIRTEYHDTDFTIEASFWTDETVSYDSIQSIYLKYSDDKGVRVSGLGTPKLLAGLFENEEFGLYTRYSYTRCHSCVVLELKNGSILVLSGTNNEKTESIYDILKGKIPS